MEMNEVTRTTDNALPVITVTLTLGQWETLAKRFFGWRTPSRYATFHGRIQALGSSDYDRFVQFAAKNAG